VAEADQPPKPKAKKDNWRPHWGLAKIYKADDPKAPYFPKDYDIVRRDVLNVRQRAPDPPRQPRTGWWTHLSLSLSL
jgi:hypothetical protein